MRKFGVVFTAGGEPMFITADTWRIVDGALRLYNEDSLTGDLGEDVITYGPSSWFSVREVK